MFFNFGNGFPNMDDMEPVDHANIDYYKVLGVDDKTSDDDIKKAYRKLSMIHHPDKNGNTEKFQEINNAYATLSDSNKRRTYDMMRNGGGGMFNHGGAGGSNVEHVFHFGGGHPSGMGGGAGIPEELLHMLFGMGGMGGMGGGVHGGPKVVFQAFHNGVPVRGQQTHSGGGDNRNSGPRIVVQPPEPIIKTVSLTLEQSFTGCSIPLEIDRQIPDNDIVKIERETMHIQVPKGVLQGDTIILNDCGNMNELGVKGDIRIIINILQHAIFKVENLDLHIEKTISLKDALCGFQFEINHLSGKVFQLSNKPGNIIKPGSIKTIPNLGLEKGGETGVIKIKFNVEFPETLTVDQINTLSRGL
jgi:DnaJ-class molecular chaperone